jgi:hypothetical protein
MDAVDLLVRMVIKMVEYMENRAVGKYFRSTTNHYAGFVRIFGTYTEYRVVAGIPTENVMLEIIGVENGILLTQVNNALFENGRGYIQ